MKKVNKYIFWGVLIALAISSLPLFIDDIFHFPLINPKSYDGDSLKKEDEQKILGDIKRMINNKELGVTKVKRNPEIIVSLTSFPIRISKIYITLHSLLTQTMKPDRIILWLAEEEFPDKKLPAIIKDLEKLGMEVKWVKKNTRGHKKLLPALKEFPKAIIITVDDDVYYMSNTVKKLYKAYKKNPSNVICTRGHKIKFKASGEIKLYRNWKHNIKRSLPLYENFCTGGGGSLYPPDILSKKVNTDPYMKLAAKADDVWFWIHTIINGKKAIIIDKPKKWLNIPIQNNQALSQFNIQPIDEKGERWGNDTQIENVLKYYKENLPAEFRNALAV